MKEVIIVSVIFLLVLIFSTCGLSRKHEETLLSGFWQADPQFCEEAGLQNMVFYIGPCKNSKRAGYILAINEEGIIINNSVDFHIFGGYTFNPDMTERHYDIVIDWLGEPEYEFFPSKQQLHYYPEEGKLIFSTADNSILALLYKDNNMSAVIRK
jgi:hypothetical protein